MKIVDLSKYNTVSDWNAVAQNVDGVIIRCGYRGYVAGVISEDNKYRMFAEQCKEAGIPFGVYFMSQAITEKEAREEADYAVNMASVYGATLPIFIDSEDGDGTAQNVRADGLSQDVRTAVVKAFCDCVVSYGMVAGVYASESWFKNRLHYDQLKDYLIWCAKYGTNNGTAQTKPAINKVDMWQYSSRGSVPGISGNVDVNECYFEISSVDKPVHTDLLVTDTTVDAYYRVAVKDKKTGVVRWLPEVKNLLDYAGLNEKEIIVGVMARASQGEMRVQAHTRGKGWYSVVTGYDENDRKNGFAGDLVNEIDAIMIYYVTPDALHRAIGGYKKAKYSVSVDKNNNFYSWQYDNETGISPDGKKQDGYAGTYGKSIDGLYLCVE